MKSAPKISSSSFYNEFHGHKISHLEALLPELRGSSKAIIWTAGDSSLDNKYWFRDRARSVGTYRTVLEPPVSVCDVTYWLHALGSPAGMAAVNAAVEASTLNERTFRLRPQDEFIRDHLSSDDILIVSVGGNDVALMPLPCTICSIVSLLNMPTACLERSYSCGTCPIDDACCGCGPSLASCACAFPPCMGYVRHLFGTRTERYIRALTRFTKPKKILVCMIYFPDEAQAPSWAGRSLEALRYNSDPAKLQLMIRTVFEQATSQIRIPGTEVVPVPLFHALDGKCTEDYVARVEPSAAGGRKMAELLLDIIQRPVAASSGNSHVTTSSLTLVSAPVTSYIQDRS
jgi:hypothetical protein